jgi:hypothetical protein
MNGARMADGDGTVPLASLGLMSAWAWRTQRLNPSNSRVITREYTDDAGDRLGRLTLGWLGRRDSSGEHVAVMAHTEVIQDVLLVGARRRVVGSERVTEWEELADEQQYQTLLSDHF